MPFIVLILAGHAVKQAHLLHVTSPTHSVTTYLLLNQPSPTDTTAMPPFQLQKAPVSGRCAWQVNVRQPHQSIAAARQRQRQHSSALVVQAAADQFDINHIYSSTDSIQQPYVGHVKAVRLKGKWSIC
jgi:hypothetical protein